MEGNKAVLVIGFLPELVDFSAFPGLTAEKVRAGMADQVEKIAQLGYRATSCLIDLGETAESVVTAALAAESFACVVIGAGVRTGPHFLLFEKVLNIVHAMAPQAKIGFNTKPTDTIEAIQRWC